MTTFKLTLIVIAMMGGTVPVAEKVVYGQYQTQKECFEELIEFTPTKREWLIRTFKRLEKQYRSEISPVGTYCAKVTK